MTVMAAQSVSLLGGWLVPSLAASGVVTLALALGWRDRRWRLVVAVAAAAAMALMWLLNVALGGSWILRPAPPLSVVALAAVPIFVVATIPLGWHGASWRQRLLVLPALLLCTLAAAGYVNRYYGYFPTVDAVLGAHPTHEVSIQQLRQGGLLGNRRDHVADASTHSRPTQAVVPAKVLPVSHASLPVRPATGGRVAEIPIPGTVSGFRARPAWVYLPPAWFSRTRPQLPVVILLEGTPASPRDWLRAVQIQRTADQWAATHHGVAPILVAVDENGSYTGDTECVDRPGSRAETYITADVRNFVARTFDVPLNPARWALEGYSEGGTCALTVALRHPDLFRTFVDIGGEPAPAIGSSATDLRQLYGGSTAVRDSYNPALLLQRGTGRRMAAWFEIGSADRHYASAGYATYEASLRNGVVAEYRQVADGHTFHLFRAGFADSFAWLCQQLQLR